MVKSDSASFAQLTDVTETAYAVKWIQYQNTGLFFSSSICIEKSKYTGKNTWYFPVQSFYRLF